MSLQNMLGSVEGKIKKTNINEDKLHPQGACGSSAEAHGDIK